MVERSSTPNMEVNVRAADEVAAEGEVGWLFINTLLFVFVIGCGCEVSYQLSAISCVSVGGGCECEIL